MPRKAGWWQWGTVRGEFGRKLAGQESPTVIGPDIDSELRRGRDYVRMVIVMTVASADVAEALAAAWRAFREAAGQVSRIMHDVLLYVNLRTSGPVVRGRVELPTFRHGFGFLASAMPSDPEVEEAGRAYEGRGGAVGSVRSMARARAVRVVTPILWKMLRRWVSTVFWLKNSSAAICGLVLRSTTSRATWSSRPVSDSMPAPLALARPGAAVGTMAELTQLSLRALAVAPRAAGVERCRRALKFGHGTIGFAGFGERPARNRARQRGLDRGSGSVGRIGRGQRPFRSEGSVAGIERDGGDGPAGPGGGEGELHGRCDPLGKSRRAPGLAGAIEGQPAPGEQLEAVRPPAAWNERQLLTAGTAEEQLDGPAWLPGLEQDAGEPGRGPGCDETFVKVAGEFDALLCGGERDVQIAGGECDDGPVEQVPG